MRSSVAGAFLSMLMALAAGAGPVHAEDVYLEPEKFLEQTFGGVVPDPRVIWINDDLHSRIDRILEHNAFAQLRVRYWQRDTRTAWILEEIGKYRPITIGIVIDSGHIRKVRILIYREGHGREVRHDFFTDQFEGLSLREDLALTGSIDNISGATLSVSAVRNVARLALFLERHVTAAATN